MNNNLSGVKISLATLVVVMLWMSGASWKVFGYVAMIEANTVAIQQVAQSLKLGRLDREIADLKSERRDLTRALKIAPENNLLRGVITEQLEEIEDEVGRLEKIRQCVVDPGKKVCQ